MDAVRHSHSGTTRRETMMGRTDFGPVGIGRRLRHRDLLTFGRTRTAPPVRPSRSAGDARPSPTSSQGPSVPGARNRRLPAIARHRPVPRLARPVDKPGRASNPTPTGVDRGPDDAWVRDHPGSHGPSSAPASAAAAQQVAAVEMNCDRPCGSPLSKNSWTGCDRVSTRQEPSDCWVSIRYRIPRANRQSSEGRPVRWSNARVWPVA